MFFLCFSSLLIQSLVLQSKSAHRLVESGRQLNPSLFTNSNSYIKNNVYIKTLLHHHLTPNLPPFITFLAPLRLPRPLRESTSVTRRVQLEGSRPPQRKFEIACFLPGKTGTVSNIIGNRRYTNHPKESRPLLPISSSLPPPSCLFTSSSATNRPLILPPTLADFDSRFPPVLCTHSFDPFVSLHASLNDRATIMHASTFSLLSLFLALTLPVNAFFRMPCDQVGLTSCCLPLTCQLMS